MWEQNDIPGWKDALESTRKDQAQAFLGAPELIAGRIVLPLNPGRLEWLKATRNPFIVGGERTVDAVIKFLFYVSPGFAFVPSEMEQRMTAFAQDVAGISFEEAVTDIYEYLDRAFLDAPTGGRECEPMYSTTANLYHSLNESYPTGEWTLAAVRETPLCVIYQLIKVADEARGCSVMNRRTAKAVDAWGQDGMTAWLKAKQAELDAVAEKVVHPESEQFYQPIPKEEKANG